MEVMSKTNKVRSIWTRLTNDDEITKSGNRPRFKRAGDVATTATSNTTANSDNDAARPSYGGRTSGKLISGGRQASREIEPPTRTRRRGANLSSSSSPPPPSLLLLLLLGAIVAAISSIQTSINCDTTTQGRSKLSPAHLNHHQHRQHHHPHGRHHHNHTRAFMRQRRQLSVDAADHSRESIKVAALASRLEQWFTCRRLQLLEPQVAHHIIASSNSNNSDELSAAGSDAGQPLSSGFCRSHFDGHLCWPTTQVGQRARLACPQLSWSPTDKQQPKPTPPTLLSHSPPLLLPPTPTTTLAKTTTTTTSIASNHQSSTTTATSIGDEQLVTAAARIVQGKCSAERRVREIIE